MFASVPVVPVSRHAPVAMRQPADLVIPGGWIVAALVVGTLALALLMRGAGLSIDPRAPGTLHFVLAFTALGAIRVGCRLPRSNGVRIARDIAEYFGLFTAISLVGALASYPVAAFSVGYVDATLYRVDRALHFDWLVWYGFMVAHPWLQIVSRAAYAMIYVSPAILLAHLAITDRRREAHDFIAAVWLSAAITLAGFRVMPAIGPFAYLWHGPIPYVPVSDLWQPELIPHLRDHSASVIDLGHLVGLVSAPSFHAAAAVLLIVFAARQRAIRVPLIAANVAMLLSTPVEGTHYLTDMILGALVALASLGIIALARAAICRFSRSDTGSAPPRR